jgi:HSP20 family protein
VRSLPEGEIRLTTSLPFEVDVANAQASYEQGIITVTLPKAEAIRPRVIQVKTVEGQKALAASTS